jgi:hypothetical protein
MQSDWILDVLTDLKTFAILNGLPAFAEQLDDTALVALAEISAQKARTGPHKHGVEQNSGSHIGGAGTDLLA